MALVSTDVDKKKAEELTACIFNIQRYSIQDGPGIRTTVFFKGCPLDCWWCCNPESRSPSPELLYFDSLCVKCHRCVDACPSGATTANPDGSILVDCSLCVACGKCVEACLSEARFISGKLMAVEEVLQIVGADSLFYRNSGGGVTASGGEPAAQPDFLLEFFKRCQEIGLTTCLDTCGYTVWETLESILEHTDLVLYDIKHMNGLRHLELVGVDNRLILENAKRIVRKGVPLVVRVPLIPGYNDSRENLKALGRFVAQLGNGRLDLLPYHQLGIKKYERLGQVYQLEGTRLFKKEEVEDKAKLLECYGLKVEIV
jgi:pyruvate formate lyase activating enzyme